MGEVRRFPDEGFVPKGADPAKHLLQWDLSTEEGTEAATRDMLSYVQPKCPVVHRFGPGIYIREATYPPNTLIIGQEHRHPHMNILLRGEIAVVDGNGNTAKLVAPFVFVAPAGAKKGYSLTEVVWQNIYATDETDVQKLEEWLFVAPTVLKEHSVERLLELCPQKQVDRDDFDKMLEDSGWSAAEVQVASARRDDCVTLPWGSYAIAVGDSPIAGKGMFATADIRAGDIIAPMRMGGYRTPAGYLVNHGAKANALAVLADNGDLYLRAIRDIEGMRGGDLGEEITLDYRQVMQLNGLWRPLSCQPQQQPQ